MVGGRKRMSLAPPLTPGTAFRQLEAEVPMDARAAVRERVAASRDRLVALSHRIHAHPELSFEEERAAVWCAEALDAAGFAVERGIADLPTAFVARAGSGPLHLALCAEYDCLPGIGHACGHNLIAAIAVGAGIAAARVADDVGLTVSVSIHPMIGIASLPVVNHQPEFTAHCVTAAADQAVADGALALAWTAFDVASDPALAARLRARGQ